ncbi:unnamed protein product [Notodromas monacha]|uniref:Uncharacterized protein n=1 Tax=Notodromas monacha TaxID=399045 RepID=A0A7R9GIX9_9CRUS|nr:unnamed protein product [Notodromas monacha]CAG0923062.1 unnamed protein product [Notodromas monacha]
MKSDFVICLRFADDVSIGFPNNFRLRASGIKTDPPRRIRPVAHHPGPSGLLVTAVIRLYPSGISIKPQLRSASSSRSTSTRDRRIPSAAAGCKSISNRDARHPVTKEFRSAPGEESSKPETHREMREAPTKFSEAFDSVQTDFCAGIKNSQDRNLSLGYHLPGTHLTRIGNRKRNQAVFKSISQKLLVLQTQYENTPVIRDELGWKRNPSLTGSGNHSSECLGSSTCCYRQRQKPEKAGATPAASQQQAAYDTASKSCTELQQGPKEEEEEEAAAAVETEARTSADTRIRGQSLLRDALCFLFGAIIFNLVRVFVSSHQDMFRPWGVPT